MTESKWLSPHRWLIIGALTLVGIAAAAGLYFFSPSATETDLFIPIESDSIKNRITVIDPRSGGLDVHLRGSKEAITRLSSQSPWYPLRIDDFTEDVQTIKVNPDQIELPDGITIVDYKPQMITARSETLVEKILPIKFVYAGTPAHGIEVAGAVIAPPSVQVRGPDRLLADLKHIKIKPINLSGLGESTRKQAILDLPDTVKPLSAAPILVDIHLKEKMASRKLTAVRIKGRGAKVPYQITPPTIDLTIKGPAQTVETVTHHPEFDVFIDLTELPEGVYVRRTVIILPINTTLIKAVPELFTIHIGSAIKQGG